MVYSKKQLGERFHLDDDAVRATLEAAGLPVKQQKYKDAEIERRFKRVRDSFEQGEASTYQEAAQIVQQELGSSDSSEPLGLDGLLARASDRCGQRPSLSEISRILQLCGLPEKDSYTAEEAEQFAEACDRLKRQSESEAAVAEHFGVSLEPAEADGADGSEPGTAITAAMAEASGEAINHASEQAAKAAAEAAPSLFAAHFAQQVSSKQIQQEFNAIGDSIEAYVKGDVKKRLEGIKQQAMQQKSRTLPSQSKPNGLPSASEDSATSESSEA